MDNAVYTILIGGRAGEGVKKAAQVIANIFCSHGFSVCQDDDYQSLIRGGHNFSIVSVSADEEVYLAHSEVDLLICFDQRSVDEHKDRLKAGGLLFYNSDEASFEGGHPISMNQLKKKHYKGAANVSVAAVAIFCAVSSLDASYLEEQISSQFKGDIEQNVGYASEVFSLVSSRSDLVIETQIQSNKRMISGNQAIIQGAWNAGLDAYYSYPMTPASSLLHYAALKQESLGIITVHAESELAAINMAIGSVMAGIKVAVGTSGGGFALMQEGFSAAGMVEAPLLCILSSRPGPATGVSTYTAQEDLFFALHPGHGEFARIVASPISIERALTLAAELLILAWQTQSPVILLTEKQLSEQMCDIDLSCQDCENASPLKGVASEAYQRYQLTDSGVSPLCFPGSDLSPQTMLKWHTHEHLENGVRTDRAEEMMAMKEKRARKYQTIKEACAKYQMYEEFGDGGELIFAYGSTVLELREALKYTSKRFKIIAPIYLEPFPEELVTKYRQAKAIVVEHSLNNSFAKFLQEKLDFSQMKTINKYDGRLFDPFKLAKLLDEVNDA